MTDLDKVIKEVSKRLDLDRDLVAAVCKHSFKCVVDQMKDDLATFGKLNQILLDNWEDEMKIMHKIYYSINSSSLNLSADTKKINLKNTVQNEDIIFNTELCKHFC